MGVLCPPMHKRLKFFGCTTRPLIKNSIRSFDSRTGNTVLEPNTLLWAFHKIQSFSYLFLFSVPCGRLSVGFRAHENSLSRVPYRIVLRDRSEHVHYTSQQKPCQQSTFVVCSSWTFMLPWTMIHLERNLDERVMH